MGKWLQGLSEPALQVIATTCVIVVITVLVFVPARYTKALPVPDKLDGVYKELGGSANGSVKYPRPIVLTAASTNSPQLLSRTDPSTPAKLTISQPVDLLTETPSGKIVVDDKAFALTFPEAPAPGVYGADLVASDSPKHETVTIVSRPAGTTLQPLTSGTVNYVDSGFDELLARSLFGTDALAKKIAIPYLNPTDATWYAGDTVFQAVPETGQTKSWKGDKDHAFNLIKRQGMANDLVDLDALSLSPGKWTIRSTHTQPGASPVKNEVTVTVRPAPFWPVVAIVAGIVVGLVFKRVSSPEATLLLQIHSIMEGAALLDPADKSFIGSSALGLDVRFTANPSDTGLTTDTANLQKQLGFLAEIESLEAKNSDKTSAYRTHLEAARKAILLADFSTANTEIQKALQTLGTNAVGADGIPQTLKTLIVIQETADNPLPVRGPDDSAQVFWLRVGRSFIQPITVFGLCFLGIKVLYVDAVVSSTLPGYVVLFFWGLSSKAAGKSLSDMFS